MSQLKSVSLQDGKGYQAEVCSIFTTVYAAKRFCLIKHSATSTCLCNRVIWAQAGCERRGRHSAHVYGDTLSDSWGPMLATYVADHTAAAVCCYAGRKKRSGASRVTFFFPDGGWAAVWRADCQVWRRLGKAFSDIIQFLLWRVNWRGDERLSDGDSTLP